MKGFGRFIQTTLLGGLFFLVPIVVTFILIGKAFGLVDKLTDPIAKMMPQGSFAGLPMHNVVAGVALFLICFLAGLIATTSPARGVVAWLERALLDRIPGYSYMKTMGQTMLHADESTALKPVIARIEDSWQLGFLVEHVPGGRSAVFIPGNPNPWSGQVYFQTEDRFRLIDVTPSQVLQCVKLFGKGGDALMRGKADWSE